MGCRRCSTSSPRKSRISRRCDVATSDYRPTSGYRLTTNDDSEEPYMNIQQMMKQAQQMQDRLQKQMAELKVEATAGGGMVTIVVNGAKQVQSLTIDPE